MTGAAGLHVSRRTLRVGGLDRTSLVVAATPTATPITAISSAGRPLLVLFHGTGQSGTRIRRFSGRSFDCVASSANAVVAYPDGHRKDWNGARAIATAAQRSGVDDVAFFIALVDDLIATHAVDPQRVFVAGFSLGGQMVMRLLHEIPERLAGAAIISSTHPVNAIVDTSPLATATTVPVIIVHGTRDPLTPYGGGIVSVHGLFSRGQHLSAPATAAYYAHRNGHDGPPIATGVITASGATAASATRLTWGDNTTAPVTLIRIEGGGHQIPNPSHTPSPWFWGRSSPDVVCIDLIASFFCLTCSSAQIQSAPSRAQTVLGGIEPIANRALNAVVKPVLASRLSWTVRWLVVTISCTGRRSGKRFTTPVMFFRRGDQVKIHVASPDSKTCWRNVLDNADRSHCTTTTAIKTSTPSTTETTEAASP